MVARELQSLVTCFDLGPLSLRELSRVAVRRAVSGVELRSRVGPAASTTRSVQVQPRVMSDRTNTQRRKT